MPQPTKTTNSKKQLWNMRAEPHTRIITPLLPYHFKTISSHSKLVVFVLSKAIHEVPPLRGQR